MACTSAVFSCWALTPSERAAAASTGDDVSAWPAANSGWSAALTRPVLICSSRATAPVIASWACRSPADPERAALAPRWRCPTCVAEAKLILACASAVFSCWALTPSERAAAASAGDDVSAWPAANSGWSAALTRAVLMCSSRATAAMIAAWPCDSSVALEPTAAVVFARALGVAAVVDATAAAVPAARTALTPAAAASILVRLRMRTLLGFVACPKGTKRDSGRSKKFLTAA